MKPKSDWMNGWMLMRCGFLFLFFETKILKPRVWDQHPDQSRLNPPGMVPSNPGKNGINYQPPLRTGELAGALVAINSTKRFFASRSWHSEMGILQTKTFMEVASYPSNHGKSPMVDTLLKTNEYLLNNWWLVQLIHSWSLFKVDIRSFFGT